ncbi:MULTISPECIES: hypothetical protein [unclassified Paraburkholderia]|uniref:hypothetical protein n=1 Tax=unclassified Paraburkholderia TaxID=2615204 RepID=UPI002AAF81A2|nr:MULTISPECIES: hypothetical protein [unclassified Paraburkholderia]
MQSIEENFVANLGMLLRDLPRGQVARLSEFVVAWWNAGQVVFAYLRDDNPDIIEEEFDLADVVWSDWENDFLGWLQAPSFEGRAEIMPWLGASTRGSATQPG